MDVKEWAYTAGFRLVFSLVLTAVTVGVTIAAFWGLDQTQYFTVNIKLFLDEFAVPFFVASFVMLQVNRTIGILAEKAV